MVTPLHFGSRKPLALQQPNRRFGPSTACAAIREAIGPA